MSYSTKKPVLLWFLALSLLAASCGDDESALPALNPAILGPEEVTIGTTATYLAQGSPNFTYQWQIPAGVTGGGNGHTVDLTFNDYGTFEITATSANYSGTARTEVAVVGPYERNTILITNEGTFSGNNASLSVYNAQNNAVFPNVFLTANGQPLSDNTVGATMESAIQDEERIFLMVSQKIVVLDKRDLSEIRTIRDVTLARYATIANGKLFVSDWGAYDANFQTPENSIKVFDLATYALEASIPIRADFRPEGLVTAGGKVWVATPGNSFGITRERVYAIDPASMSITDSLDIASEPKQMVEDVNGKVWVLSSSGNLSRFNPTTLAIEASFDMVVSLSTTRLVTNPAKDRIFFLKTQGIDFTSWGTELYSVQATASNLPPTPLVTGLNYYGMGIHPENGDIYVADHSGFTGNGEVWVYTSAGQLKGSFTAGAVPNGILFYGF